ncbi:MAG: Xaa-Pro peptidase family protein [Candidatus Binatia bacterium]|jgi:Xaa-Pro aminopeptidase|nr:Xaa-Pro peptidase family protein [Candidatus Binatia bacterium]
MPHDPLYVAFSDAEYERRHRQVRERMDRSGVSALLLFGRGRSPEIHYLCNWLTTTEAHLIFPIEGKQTLFVQLSNHLPNARRMSIIEDVRFGGSNSAGAVDSVPRVAENIKERKLEENKVGIVGGLPYRQYERLREALPKVEWVDFSAGMRDQRQIKSKEEIERLRKASAMSDCSIAALAELARPGIVEHELAKIVEDAYLGAGGTNGIHFMITTSMRDPKGGIPQQHMSNRVLQKGDVLVTEISANYLGYTGQILRTFSIGEGPTPEYQRIHDVAVEAFDRVADVIKDGTDIDQVLDAAEVVHERGYTIYDDFLHGAGQLPPILRTRKTYRGTPQGFRFQEDMCLVIQPNVITEDAMRGVQFGEMFQVTKAGLNPFHDYPRELIVCQKS